MIRMGTGEGEAPANLAVARRSRLPVAVAVAAAAASDSTSFLIKYRTGVRRFARRPTSPSTEVMRVLLWLLTVCKEGGIMGLSSDNVEEVVDLSAAHSSCGERYVKRCRWVFFAVSESPSAKRGDSAWVGRCHADASPISPCSETGDEIFSLLLLLLLWLSCETPV